MLAKRHLPDIFNIAHFTHTILLTADDEKGRISGSDATKK